MFGVFWADAYETISIFSDAKEAVALAIYLNTKYYGSSFYDDATADFLNDPLSGFTDYCNFYVIYMEYFDTYDDSLAAIDDILENVAFNNSIDLSEMLYSEDELEVVQQVISVNAGNIIIRETPTGVPVEVEHVQEVEEDTILELSVEI